MARFYAGIGPRAAPFRVQGRITTLASLMRAKGWTLRSGGAIGADAAFARGAGPDLEVFRLEDATPEAVDLAAQFHPKWEACSGEAMMLHGRNAMIVLGRDLSTPVERVICGVEFDADEVTGGSAMGVRIARAYGIPVSTLLPDTGVEQVAFDF